ncbi:MAG: heparan-alpha-glucosaminide N-acetyltransferase domain-containing protein [Gemmatimonadota bacterium]
MAVVSTQMLGEAAGPTRPAPRRMRIESVDLLRGAIMVLMALDHTRDFFGIPGQNPVDLTTASAGLFLTRWVTFICAPVFFLLTGTGAQLSLPRKSPRALSHFLFTRGLWLIVLDLVVARTLAYQFNVDYQVTMLLVLWALGWSMITLSALVHFRASLITAFGLILIAGHNLLDGVRLASPLWNILHVPGFVVNTPDHIVFVAYPLIPWIGVTAVGFGLGQVYQWDGARRRAFLLWLGLGLCAAFVVVRGINGYGDPSPWSPQRSVAFTALSFLNTTKYPPSLQFLLMTLGPALLVLWAVDRCTPALLRPAVLIGRVPMFYYLGHFLLIHLLAVATCLVRYGSAHWMFQSPDLGHYPFSPPPGWGYSLLTIYLIWAFVVLGMYPLCRWYAGVKQRRSDWWLSYL